MSEKTLVEQLDEVNAELRNERQRGALGDYAKITELEAQQQSLLEQIQQQERGAVEQKQVESVGGLKETIYQIWDIVFPVDQGNSLLGINEYTERSANFRRLIDAAVNENNAAFMAYIGEQLEGKDGKIRELTTSVIDLDAKLQEANRKEQAATEAHDGVLAEYEALEASAGATADKVTELEAKVSDLNEQLKAKDEQITKLTEEVNKPAPTPQILLPNTSKPSASLSAMMEEVKNKTIRSARDIALSGDIHRGPVTITPPALGGSNDTVSFQGESSQDHQTVAPGSGILDPGTVLTGSEQFQEETVSNGESGLSQAEQGVGVHGTEQTVEDRLAELEIAVFGKAKVAA